MSFDIKKALKREFNVGRKDFQIRLGAGLAVMIAASLIESGLLMLAGILVIVTGVMRWCPAYSVLGKSTVEEGEIPPAF